MKTKVKIKKCEKSYILIMSIKGLWQKIPIDSRIKGGEGDMRACL